jgi:hypothetical protein
MAKILKSEPYNAIRHKHCPNCGLTRMVEAVLDGYSWAFSCLTCRVYFYESEEKGHE